jgi:hypothetical protein
MEESELATRNKLKPEYFNFKIIFHDKTDTVEVFRSDRINRTLTNRSWDPINPGPGSVLINNDAPVVMVNRSDEYSMLHAHASEAPAFILLEGAGDVQQNYRGMGGMKVVHFSMIKPFDSAGKTSSQVREHRLWTLDVTGRRLAHYGIVRGEQVPASFADLEGERGSCRAGLGGHPSNGPALRQVTPALYRVRWSQDALPPAAIVPAAPAPSAALSPLPIYPPPPLSEGARKL